MLRLASVRGAWSRAASPMALTAGISSRRSLPTCPKMDDWPRRRSSDLSFIRARDYTNAIAIANGTEYGLTGGVYSRDRRRLEQARAAFQVGNLYFNRKITGAMVGAQPFGGFDMSGTDSKAGGPDYLQLFQQAKVVVERF